MTVEEIVELVISYLNQSLAGAIVENQKFDFKREWYDLSTPQGKNEFFKDTSAMANTFGPDGFIVIGYDDKTLEFQASKFTDSKLSDTSRIPDLINKHVDRIYNLDIYDRIIDGHLLSIIHILPSIDKPHVIRNYQTFHKDGALRKEEHHKVFVRRVSTAQPANKNDYELMYYDRKNVLPEYRIHASFHYSNLRFNIETFDSSYPPNERIFNLKIQDNITVTFETLGQRPISISKIRIDLNFPIIDGLPKMISIISDISYSPVIIQPGNMENSRNYFHIMSIEQDKYPKVLELKRQLELQKNIVESSMLLILSTGKNIICDMTISTG